MSVPFSDFYASLNPDPLKRGKQFEYFVKWFLKSDPEWATQVEQVWLWDEWPGRWGADCGIDLVFQHKNGDHWAVQAKCYSPDYDITKHDVDKFLSESNRPLIQHRLLIATTDRIGNNAKQVCDAQDKPVIRFLLSDFEKSALEYPTNLNELSQAKRKAPPAPREQECQELWFALRGAGSSFAVVTSLTLRLHSGDVLRSALTILSLPVPGPPEPSLSSPPEPSLSTPQPVDDDDAAQPQQWFLSQYLAGLPRNASVTLFGLDAYFKAYFFLLQVGRTGCSRRRRIHAHQPLATSSLPPPFFPTSSSRRTRARHLATTRGRSWVWG